MIVNNKIYKFVAISFFLLTCFLALMYYPVSFDGAFHSNLGLNFFKHGIYEYSYPLSMSPQIRFPFQLVNGFLIYFIGNNLWVPTFTGLLYFCLLFYFIHLISRQLNNNTYYLSILPICFLPYLFEYGFGGYGEIPALALGLMGLYFYSVSNDKYGDIVAGVFIGLSIATKWIMLSLIPPLLFLFLFKILDRRYVSSLFFLLIAILVVWLCSLMDSSVYSESLRHLSTEVSFFSNGGTENFDKILTNLREKINVYRQYSSDIYIFCFKLALFIYAVYYTVRNFTINKYDKIYRLIVALLVFIIVYYLWWFLIAATPWYRRLLAADITFFALVFLVILKENSPKIKTTMFTVFMILTLIMGGIYITKILSFKNSCLTSFEFQNKFEQGLKKLPKQYIPMGYGWWQAPRWSFLTGKKFYDLNKFSRLDLKKIIENGNECYLFVENENILEKNGFYKVNKKYALEPVYEWEGYGIYKISSSAPQRDKLLPIIDYAKFEYPFTGNIYSRESGGYAWTKQKSFIELRYVDNSKFVLDFQVEKESLQYSPDFSIEVLAKGVTIAVFSFKKPGRYEKIIEGKRFSKFTKNGIISIELRCSNSFTANNDRREFGVMLRKVGFWGLFKPVLNTTTTVRKSPVPPENQ